MKRVIKTLSHNMTVRRSDSLKIKRPVHGSGRRTGVMCLALVFSFLAMADISLAKDPVKSAGNVKVYRFDNLDVEGKVKAPQLMYFLKRIRSKFRSFRLPKQNFTKKIIEMKDSELL